MNYLTSQKFSFVSRAFDKDTFGVVKFSGTDGLSQLYHFDIMLVADDPNIDMDKVLQEQATFYIHRPDGSRIPFHGILAEFDLVREVGQFYLYRALLVPKLWRLTLTHHNQIFLSKNARDIISEVLADGGLTSLDYEFRLQGNYTTWEYVCQYGESHYSFISRWMERSGMYYFFDQLGESERVIITDTRMAHAASIHGSNVTYAPVSGLEAFHLDEAVQSFVCRRKTVPQKVLLKDYNYQKPSLEVTGQADVSGNGYGEMYYYGDHFRTPEEGDILAKVRSEELLCRAVQFHGESTVPYVRPGYTFQLTNHFRQDINRGYLTIANKHYGNQASALISGLKEKLTGSEQESVYRNSFTAIGDDIQFRPERETERPRLHGTISARIDGAGSGQYAELDDQGRYKVIFPFDMSGRKGGKASAWLRMMQPYVGSDHGMHFPLHKGTEVLLSFIDGDPDRPVIAGAVANPENPSQVTSDNQTMAKLTTSGGNKIHIEDKQGSERILMHTPNAGSWIRIGMPNDPSDDDNNGDNIQTFTITTEAGANGSISPAGPVQAESNSRQSFTIVPDAGYKIGSVSGCAGKLSGSTYTIDSITSDCTISATFEKTDEKKDDKNFFEKIPELWTEEHGIKIATNGWWDVRANFENKVILGEATEWIGGLHSLFVLGGYAHNILGGVMEFHYPEKWEIGNFAHKLHTQMTQVVATAHTRMTTDKTTIVAAAHTEMTTDKTTIVAAARTDMTTEKTTIVAAARTEMSDEATTIVATANTALSTITEFL